MSVECEKCGKVFAVLDAGGVVYCGIPDLPASACGLCEIREARIERDPLLQEREKTHGSFAKTARIAQSLKDTIATYTTKDLTLAQSEVLDMICTKIGRILSGNPREKDHWRDIAGYAKLGEEECDD